MEKKYVLHAHDAVVGKIDEESVTISLQKQGVACKPHQRKEAEKICHLLNWYDKIDFDILSDQFDENTLNFEACEGIGNMVRDLMDISEDLKEMENLKHKDNIEKIVIEKLSLLQIDVPENIEDIVQFVFEDVMETADYPNYSDGDISIGLRRWIEQK